MIYIVIPSSETENEKVREIMRAFVAWHIKRHGHDLEMINRYFDRNEFDKELRAFPG